MGTCLSKKCNSSPSDSAAAFPPPDPNCKAKQEEKEQKKVVEAEDNVKEIFVIKQRKSHERRPEEKGGGAGNISVKDEYCNGGNANNGARSNTPVTVRTSSCTKEQVDAILIQCGRLSRSSSGSGKVAGSSDNNGNSNNSRGPSGSGSRKYSGSKRSYDFDHNDTTAADKKKGNNDADDEAEEDEDKKQQRRHSSPSHTHRRTRSREKEVDYKRSSSRDRTSGEEKMRSSSGGGRRVSRSPGRRSETSTATAAACSTVVAPTSNLENSRPGRIVSVPPSVSTRDKSNGASAAVPEPAGMTIKRVSVKRNGEMSGGGGLRTAASPRSQSPANTRTSSNENVHQHTQPSSLSRNSSRKAEHSPYRRNPMTEINDNVPSNEQFSLINNSSKATSNSKSQRNKEGGEERLMNIPSQIQAQKLDEKNNGVVAEIPHGTSDNNIRCPRENSVVSCGTMEQKQQIVEEQIEAKGLLAAKTSKVAVTGTESLKPQTITRSRSSRRSRDLDLNLGFNTDTLNNPTSYASLLLEDIQNFHQQSTTAFSLPPCVTKACSILEAVADLNSCTSSNISSVFSEDKISEADRFHNRNVVSSSHLGKRTLETNEPFSESELVGNDDLMEPSLHKYVTVRRSLMAGEKEQQESSGSNSFIGQHWASSSREPHSVDSTERWTSGSKYGDEVVDTEQPNPLGCCQRQAFSAQDVQEVDGRRLRHSGNNTLLPTEKQNGRKKELDCNRTGIGRGKIGVRSQTTAFVAAASAST